MAAPVVPGVPAAPAIAADGWLDAVRFDERGLVTAIAQEVLTQRILMVAWMDRQALEETARTGQAVYWSRSRRRLWRKGEESGNVQKVREIRTDCDGDVVLLKVEQVGGVACHTGRHSCFFNLLQDGRWVVTDPVLADPATLYGEQR
jgi:phosphoribosyl-AMP cyclohydrolase